MKKGIAILLTIVVAAIVVLAVALPIAVPPIAKSFAESAAAEHLGLNTSVNLSLGYEWNAGPELVGKIRARVTDTPWKVRVDFGVGFGTYHADVQLPKTEFDQTDPLLVKVLGEIRKKQPPSADGLSLTNLLFKGSIALSASVSRTRRKPVPVWKAEVPIRIDSAELTVEDKPFAASGIALTPAASGIADHVDISPLFLRASSLDADGFTLSNFHASVRADPKSVLVTEAGAETCDGKVNLYSLYLNPENLNAGFTLFVDNIDAGEILKHIKGFRGRASGRLHGKVRLFVKEGGKAVRLSDAFLYSTPGEVGKLEMSEPETVTDNLALAGIDEATRSNVANALTNLDYDVLRFDLKRLEGKNATLGVRIEGSATRGDQTVPVNLTINIHGELEQIINTGLGYSNKLKGKSK